MAIHDRNQATDTLTGKAEGTECLYPRPFNRRSHAFQLGQWQQSIIRTNASIADFQIDRPQFGGQGYPERVLNPFQLSDARGRIERVAMMPCAKDNEILVQLPEMGDSSQDVVPHLRANTSAKSIR